MAQDTRETVKREKHPMRGRMVGADFGDNTATFEMIGDYYAASGEYVITPAESIAALSPPAPSAEVAALVEAKAEIDRLNAIINSPQSDDFLRAVSTEAYSARPLCVPESTERRRCSPSPMLRRWGGEGALAILEWAVVVPANGRHRLRRNDARSVG
jgi:hypothetical protein